MIHTGLGPLDIQRGSTFKYGRLAYTSGRFKAAGIRQRARRGGSGRTAEDRSRRGVRVELREIRRTTSKSRICTWSADATRGLVWRQLPLQQLRSSRSHRWARTAAKGVRTCRTRSSCRTAFRWIVGVRLDAIRRAEEGGAVAAYDAAGQAKSRADDPPVLQPCVSRALVRQQLPRHQLSSSRRSSLARRVSACRSWLSATSVSGKRR